MQVAKRNKTRQMKNLEGLQKSLRAFMRKLTTLLISSPSKCYLDWKEQTFLFTTHSSAVFKLQAHVERKGHMQLFSWLPISVFLNGSKMTEGHAEVMYCIAAHRVCPVLCSELQVQLRRNCICHDGLFQAPQTHLH